MRRCWTRCCRSRCWPCCSAGEPAADELDQTAADERDPTAADERDPTAADELDQTAYAQPAIFAVSWSLAQMWRAWGIEPDAVMGHSFGEFAAACCAGALSLEDAARMVAARGRLAQALPHGGAMAVVEAGEAAVGRELARRAGPLSIAAINGANNTVVSGDKSLVADLCREFAATGARTKLLRVSHAFHSPLMDPILDRFEAEIADVRYAEPQIPLVSNLSGRFGSLALIGEPGYWRRHLREPVRFAAAMQQLADRGVTHFIEMSPHPVLLAMASEVVPDGTFIASLRQGSDDATSVAEAIQQLYCAGVDFDWLAVHRDGGPRRHRALPTYPFQRKRHWIDAAVALPRREAPEADPWSRLERVLSRESERAPIDVDVASYPAKWQCLERLSLAVAVGVLLDSGLFSGRGERLDLDGVMTTAGFGSTYRHLVRRWLERLEASGHLVADDGGWTAVEPLVRPDLEAAFREAGERFGDNRPLLGYVRHCAGLAGPVLRGEESPLETLFPGGAFDLAQDLYERSATTWSSAKRCCWPTTARRAASRRSECLPATGHSTSPSAASRATPGTAPDAWTRHASRRLRRFDGGVAEPIEPKSLQLQCPEHVDTDAFYSDLLRRGLDFGPTFRTVRELWKGHGTAFATVEIAASGCGTANDYAFHPSLLDGCLQAIAAALADASKPDGTLYLPIGIGRYLCHRRPTTRCRAFVAIAAGGNETTRANLLVRQAEDVRDQVYRSPASRPTTWSATAAGAMASMNPSGDRRTRRRRSSPRRSRVRRPSRWRLRPLPSSPATNC